MKIVISVLAILVSASWGTPVEQHITPDDPSNGFDVIRAMHDTYQGTWYDKLHIRQEVTYYKDGHADRTEVWNEVLELPGSVCSIVGDFDDGNRELFTGDTVYIFRDDSLVHKRKIVHSTLLLGFDVYLQDPRQTTDRLSEAGFDLNRLHEALWRDRPVFVVGALEGDFESNQFWIDKELLVLVRKIERSASGENLIDIEFNDLQRLDGGWVAMELVFRRNGELALTEKYLNVDVPERVDRSVFEIAK